MTDRQEKGLGYPLLKENHVGVHGKYQCSALCKPKFLELLSG